MTVPTVCLLIEVFLSRDSFLFPLCVRTSEIKKGEGRRGSLSLSPPYFSFLSRVESCFSLYRVRCGNKGKEEWDDQTNTVSHEGWTIALRSRGEKERRCFALCFCFLLSFFFSSRSTHPLPPSPPSASWLGVEKGVTPGAHPVVPDGFQ